MFYKGRRMKGIPHPSTDFHGFGGAIREELARRLPRRSVNVLDVGTGFAGNALFLAKALPEGSRIWTLDPSDEVLARAKKSLRAEGLDHRVEFVRATVEKTDFGGHFFDLIFSVMALHHLKNLGDALDEMTRVLKPGGKVILVDFEPKAARELEFTSLHREPDFFAGNLVESALAGRMTSAKISRFGLWYLVEGTK